MTTTCFTSSIIVNPDGDSVEKSELSESIITDNRKLFSEQEEQAKNMLKSRKQKAHSLEEQTNIRDTIKQYKGLNRVQYFLDDRIIKQYKKK